MQQVKQKLKMLLVDNNRCVQMIIKENLSAKMLITSASDFREAKHKLMNLDVPDIIVLYLHTDGHESGYQLLKLIRSSNSLEKVIVILLGRSDGFVITTERIEAFQRGADYCLAKPFNPEEFELIITALFRTKGTLKYNETL